MNPFGISKAIEPYQTPKGEIYFEDRGPGYKGQTQGARKASDRDKKGFKLVPKEKPVEPVKAPPFDQRHPAGAHPDSPMFRIKPHEPLFRDPFRSVFDTSDFNEPYTPRRYEVPVPKKRLSGTKKGLIALGGLGAIGTAAVAANMADDRRRAKRKVSKRDNKRDYTALGLAAGGAAAGAGGVYLMSRGRASKVVLKPVEVAAKAPKVKIKEARLPGTPEGLKPPTDLPPPSQPGVPNAPVMTDAEYAQSVAAENNRNAAQRIARKQRQKELRAGDEESTRSAAVPKAPGAEEPARTLVDPVKYPSRSVAESTDDGLKGVEVVQSDKKPKFKYNPMLKGKQAPKNPFLGNEGRSIFGKSFIRVNGELVAKPISQLKATGKLAERVHPMGDAGARSKTHNWLTGKPIPIESRSNVTIEDARTARDVSQSWQTVRRWADGHPDGGAYMDPPKHTWRKNGRKVKAGDVSPLGAQMKYQNFSATAAQPVKDGYQVGSQRKATAVVALNPKLKGAQRADFKAHEMTHVDVRKPMSRDVRHYRHPEKMWGDEGRADMAMSRKTRRKSAYLWATKWKPIANALPGRYKEGFDAGGREKYLDVQAKIRAARIKAGDEREMHNPHTKRNVILATTGAGVGAGAAVGGTYAYKNRKKAS